MNLFLKGGRQYQCIFSYNVYMTNPHFLPIHNIDLNSFQHFTRQRDKIRFTEISRLKGSNRKGEKNTSIEEYNA